MSKAVRGDELPDAVATYVKLVRTAEALHAEVSRGLALEGLTASQFSTLKVLRLRGPLAQKDIASNLLKTGGNVTVVVDNLEKRKLVSRARDSADRRLVFVELTREGRELFDRLYPSHLARIRGAMGTLDERELCDLGHLLDRLRECEDEKPCPTSE